MFAPFQGINKVLDYTCCQQPFNYAFMQQILEYLHPRNCSARSQVLTPLKTAMSQALLSLTVNRSFLTDPIQPEKPCCALGMVEVEDQ